MTDEERLEEIKSREDAATPGPWKARAIDYGDHYDEAEVWVSDEELASLRHVQATFSADGRLMSQKSIDQAHANATFIANSREDIPWLVERLEAVDQDRDALRTAMRRRQKTLERIRGNLPELQDDPDPLYTVQDICEAIDDCLADGADVLLPRTDAPPSVGEET